jgi:hypothetical protein
VIHAIGAGTAARVGLPICGATLVSNWLLAAAAAHCRPRT